jgi:hypothetical protein
MILNPNFKEYGNHLFRKLANKLSHINEHRHIHRHNAIKLHPKKNSPSPK